MDTPERDQIETPMSKFEESPFSNFINSLSPIKPIKAINISQTFSSLSFSSPPSVFTSPHVSLQKESRLLRRHQLSELAKPEFTSTDDRSACKTEVAAASVPQLGKSSTEGVHYTEISSGEGAFEPLFGVSGETIELPRDFNYGCASPNCRTYMISRSDMRSEADTSSVVPFGEGSLRGRAFAAEFQCHDTKENNEGTSCELDSLISDTTDLFVFDSPNDTAGLKGKSQRPMDTDISFLASVFSHFPQDGVNSQQNTHPLGSISSDDQNGSKDHFNVSAEASGEKQIQQEQDSMEIISINDCFSSNPSKEVENELAYNCHRGTRRRCLVFEISGARKNVDRGLFSSSLHEGKNGNTRKRMNSLISGSNTPQCLVPGIGLHLNALAVPSKEHPIPSQEAACSEERVTAPGKTTLEYVLNSSDSTCLEKEIAVDENAYQVIEEASQASASVTGEDLAQNSPKKKRRKTENTGEVEACKRCNCKKSKCLKLYCECFAAGVYCMESCSCQDCFNKPIHEDTVLATRKQIESRNPLAFAPKVIRSSENTPDLGDDSTRTPASARHKRGCNCKKSSCLKKYCECYQGGVGCSISCRCEGCQNVFGRKDGCMMLGIEAEVEEETPGCEKGSMGKCQVQPGVLNEEQNSETTIPRTPSRHLRSSSLQPSSSKGKPPRSFSGLHPCDRSVRTTFLRSQHNNTEKRNQAVSEDDLPVVLQGNGSPGNGIKTLSPNSKRVSPPHHDIEKSLSGPKTTRKLILQSIPAFPSLNSSALNG
ncbi:hypothetical protein Dimus_028951 [Dionaea muscipula]